MLSSAQLQKIHHVTLGFEDSFLLTWRDTNGKDHINSQNLPTELKDFLYARNSQKKLLRNIAKLRCTLGPYNDSFLAHDGSNYRWMNLPADLLSALQSRINQGSWTDRPRIVTLGANNNFVLVTEKHAAIWNLGNYKTGSKLLGRSNQKIKSIVEISNIALHPYRYDSFITQSRNGTLIHNNLPSHALPNVQAIIAPVLQDTKSLEAKPLVRRTSEMRSENKSEKRSESQGERRSEKRSELPRQTSNIQQRAQFRANWDEHTREYTAQSKGIKLSLKLSVSAGGLSRLLG